LRPIVRLISMLRTAVAKRPKASRSSPPRGASNSALERTSE
jgi:hypothetical protein